MYLGHCNWLVKPGYYSHIAIARVYLSVYLSKSIGLIGSYRQWCFWNCSRRVLRARNIFCTPTHRNPHPPYAHDRDTQHFEGVVSIIDVQKFQLDQSIASAHRNSSHIQ